MMHTARFAAFSALIALTGGAAAALGAAPDPSAKKTSLHQQDRYKNLELFQKVLHFIESNYVEEVKNDDLMYGAIKGMMETLDPHSSFLPPEIFKDMKIDTSGKFGGLGIEITLKDNVLTVAAPIEDTPAWKAGIKPDDRIVKIDGESTKGMNLAEAVQRMRGKKGSKVTVSIFRPGADKVRDVVMFRDTIKIKAVKSELIEDGMGYLRITQFNESVAQDAKAALESMEKKRKLKGLVLDMRTNPGGLLDQAVDVTSLFIDEGVVVSTIGRNKAQKEVKYAKGGWARKDFPLAILVNSSTASASEIVAGALQDHKRGIVMGQPTFGKGSVQTVIELGNDMGLKLTIARYYTPSGKSIQEKGVVPDVLLDEYDPKLLAKAKISRESTRERDLKSHLVNPEADSEAKKNPKEEFTREELEVMAAGKKPDASGTLDAEDMVPLKFNPKDDYQVKTAVNFLKSYDVFKKLTLTTIGKEPAVKPQATSVQ